MELKETLEQMGRNSITLTIAGEETYKPRGTRFGGKPDVPPGFVWPTYMGKAFDGETKDRPLAFLAQFNCEELATYDKEHLLPDRGLLAFFYEVWTQPWGYDPRHKGCARVYWFEDPTVLTPAEFPAELGNELRFPMIHITAAQVPSFPCWEDHPGDEDFDTFDSVWQSLDGWGAEVRSKLLGWPDVIQNCIAIECDMVTQGYYLGHGWDQVPPDIRQRAESSALDRWLLLFQLDTVETGGACLEFGDCGRIYFFIPREDLLARRFDRVWLVLQCG